jgi:hypothetical protein
MAHSHATEPKGRDFQVAVSEFSFLHFPNSYRFVNQRISGT